MCVIFSTSTTFRFSLIGIFNSLISTSNTCHLHAKINWELENWLRNVLQMFRSNSGSRGQENRLYFPWCFEVSFPKAFDWCEANISSSAQQDNNHSDVTMSLVYCVYDYYSKLTPATSERNYVIVIHLAMTGFRLHWLQNTTGYQKTICARRTWLKWSRNRFGAQTFADV